MRNFLYFCVICTFLSCSQAKSNKAVSTKSADSVTVDTAAQLAKPLPKTADAAEEQLSDDLSEMQTYYVVVAEEGQNYHPLQERLLQLAQESRLPIDSLGRKYNEGLKKLVITDPEEIDMFGEVYYPRRFETDYLSIEYANAYIEHLPYTDNTLYIVAGQYPDKKMADKRMAEIKKYAPKVKIVKAEMFDGCLH